MDVKMFTARKFVNIYLRICKGRAGVRMIDKKKNSGLDFFILFNFVKFHAPCWWALYHTIKHHSSKSE